MSKASTAQRKPPRAASPRKKPVTIPQAVREQDGEGALNKHWRTYFLVALVETSNITASAAKAGISPSRAYRVRREDPGFAAQWRVALREGYENLEMELLGYLRCPDPERKLHASKMDVANAIRLLSQHRESVARDRALEADYSEAEVLDSIDAMIDEMRTRAAANAALLATEGASDLADEE